MALSHAILASLLHQPCSGYDLRKQFAGSVGFFWHASFQQIYRELSKLEELGWIQAETIQQASRPDKKVYHVTSTGAAHLQAWIAAPSEMAVLRDDLLVKVFAGYTVPREIFLAELQRHQVQHQNRLTEYQQIEQRFFANPHTLPIPVQFHYLTLRNGIRFETGWLAWCEEAIALLDNATG